ncbi:enoyl-CoA hydratase/isomerase family protein [Paludifilum halophilum]|uniref:Enoyl-CoA hydratase n=1 Tax=Paludifilum halophilum TaxID=1642702 RepID=A0A235B6A7_9BACL|nr:enoyl-CoA hydratase/isomerase family protein [Paludifilum halophilum]OYD07838.1 hypothetical protein CHM34_10320 [Paludifilum halophilum]
MKTIKTEREAGTGWIIFHRPQVRNAVNTRMMEELEFQLDRWREDDEVKALVFAGDERTFVSGGDLDEFHRLTTREQVYPVMRRMGSILEQLRNFGKPTIAAVEGAAVGGGCEIAASCNFRLASEKAVFGFIQSRLGITTGWGGGSRLLEDLPRGEALYLLLSGEKVSAEWMFRRGWIHRVFPAASFHREVRRFVKQLTDCSLPVIRAYLDIDQARREGAGEGELVDMESDYCSKLWESEEHTQAVKGFLNRRKEKKN